MSKRKRPSSKIFREKHPREVGKFYHKEDTSGGHPVLIYEENVKEDTYSIQRFSTKPKKGRVKLKHNIDPKNDKNDQWLVKKPEATGYDVKYLEKYKDFRVHPDDIDTVKKYQKSGLKKKIDERSKSTM